MTNDELKQMYELLPLGASEALNLGKCKKTLGFKYSRRKLRKVFEEMISNGLPVCNLRRGYFRPATDEELIAYIKIIHSYKCKFDTKETDLQKALSARMGIPVRDLPLDFIKRRGRDLQEAREGKAS